MKLSELVQDPFPALEDQEKKTTSVAEEAGRQAAREIIDEAVKDSQLSPAVRNALRRRQSVTGTHKTRAR
ncbi:MAG TPA: hypothetical protein VIM28_04330 [Solirubrobacterales bacterium]